MFSTKGNGIAWHVVCGSSFLQCSAVVPTLGRQRPCVGAGLESRVQSLDTRHGHVTIRTHQASMATARSINRTYKVLTTNCVWNLKVQAHTCTITGHTTKQGSFCICLETWLLCGARPATHQTLHYACAPRSRSCVVWQCRTCLAFAGLMWWTWGF